MSETEIIERIILYLYQQPLGEKVSLSKLLDVLDLSSPEVLIDALSKLESIGCIEMAVAGSAAMLCWLTYDGRKMAQDLQRQAERQPSSGSGRVGDGASGRNGNDIRPLAHTYPAKSGSPTRPLPVIPSPITESESLAASAYPEFSWTVEGLTSQCAQSVQRQELIDQILRILEEPNDYQIPFLYGSPQVGKTFILKQLQKTLPERYVPVVIHVNGWQSIGKLSAFLYELAGYIKSRVEFWERGVQIEPFRAATEFEATIEFSNFMDNLLQCLRADEKRLLLMFDELEYLTEKDTDEQIFKYLTGCIERYLDQEVRFIFAGSGQLLELVQGGSLAKLWTKGQSFKISCFAPTTSREITLRLTERYFRLEAKALERVIHLGNGHPSLLRGVLAILVYYWRSQWRKNKISENDLNAVLEEICIKLSPELRDIWAGLSSQEQDVLLRIARSRKISFREHDLVMRSESSLKAPLKQLVRQQILDDSPTDNLYVVRLGLIVESLSYNILSVSPHENE